MICKGKTQADKPCKRTAMGNGFCRQHGGRDNELRTESTTTDSIREESLKRFAEREKRNGNLSGYNRKLDIDLDLFKEIHPGMVPHWFADRGSRLAEKYNIGWAFVPSNNSIAVGDPVPGGGNTDIAGRISVIGGEDSSKAEGAYRLVLMLIPEEIHEKIVAAKQERNNLKDDEINREMMGEGQSRVDGKYTPESGGSQYVP